MTQSTYRLTQVPRADIPRSTFLRNHGHKTTFDQGLLVPIYVDEVLPGDTYHLNMSLFARMTTPIVPIMDNIQLDVFFFFVPNRLVWDNWQKFCGEQVDPGDSTDYTVPQILSETAGFTPQTIFDYFGIPTGVNTSFYFNALPLRAYNLIWNEWFRDQNQQNSLTVYKGDGPDPYTAYSLQFRNRIHDYFMSALPWPQKGPGVEIPIAGATVLPDGTNAPTFRGTADATARALVHASTNSTTTWSGGTPTATEQSYWVDPNLLVGTGGGTINDLRTAFQLQRLYERDARGGTRYTEILRSHFRVTSPDARLQRPEFLGGGTTPLVVNPVSQTSSTDATTPQGNLAAYAIAGNKGLGFTKSFVEHGYIIGLIEARADVTYQQGLNRMWSRQTREEFYWPALAHLGEQAILTKEIYCTGGILPTDQDNTVYGYQERWSEYRYHPSIVSGLFRSNAPGTLDFWHLAIKYIGKPTLNGLAIQDQAPMTRILAVANQPHFLMDTFFNVRCARPMPMYSVPGLADHF